MNVIFILLDSLNRHYLPCYGNDWVKTPNIDRLARRSTVMGSHYIGSMPCMPARHDLYTGNLQFLWRPWGAIEPWEADLPGHLKANGVMTQLVTDHYHLLERGGETYHINFEGWEFIRGHENDPWETTAPPKPAFQGRLTDRYWRNMQRMRREEDFTCPRTMQAAAQWLEKNHDRHDRFFCMIDEFDPHEPFHVPEQYERMYDPDWNGPLFFWPRYGEYALPEREARHIRAQYAGKITMADQWLGRLLDVMDEKALWDDTMVILTTDHGHFLGDHGWWGKTRTYMYQEVAHIPLLIHYPGSVRHRKTIDALSTHVDIFATILDAFGLEAPTPIHGRSLLPILRGEKDRVRDWVLYGYYSANVHYCDGRYTYFRSAGSLSNTPLYVYTNCWSSAPWHRFPQPDERLETGAFVPWSQTHVGRMPMPQEYTEGFRGPPNRPRELYCIHDDPRQQTNLAQGDLESRYAMHMKMAMREAGCPPDQFQRMGLA